MGIEKMVNDLYKFLKTDVTDNKLFEATDNAYKGDIQYLKEGKLPDDPSLVKDPAGDIQKLAEDKKEDKEKKKEEKEAAKEEKKAAKEAGDVKPAEMTDEVAKSKVEKQADDKTPGIEKKTDPLAVVKDAEKMKEGKLPADLSQIQKPEEEIYMLSEAEVETPLTELPDEETAKKIVNKLGVGKSRYEKNQKGQFTVYTKEAKKEEVKVTGVKVEGAKDAKDVIKKQQESKKIKEDATTEPTPAEVKAAEVPDVDDKNDVNVDAAPISKANPDNKDKGAVAGEVSNDADVSKVVNANPDNKDAAGIVKEDIATSPEDIDPIKQGADKGEQQTKKAEPVNKGADNQYVGKAGPTVAGDAPKDIDPVKQGADDGEKQTQASQSVSKKNENATTEPTAGEVKAAAVPDVDAKTNTDVDAGKVTKANPDNKDKKEVGGEVKNDAGVDKVVKANPDNKDAAGIVKEEVEVTVNADGKKVDVSTDASGATTVTTNPSTSTEVTAEVPAVPAAEVAVEPKEEELPAEELEVAEKLFLADYLAGKKKLSEKEQKFIKETRSIKLSKQAWERVHKKVAQLKGKK